MGIAGGRWLTDGEACVGVDFGDGLGLQVFIWARRWREGVGGLMVVGEVGLVAEGTLE